MSIDLNRETERRVLVVAPTAKDGKVTSTLLANAGLACLVCKGLQELVHEVEVGASIVLLTEECLTAPGIDRLLSALGKQPPWSDLPVVLLLRGGSPSRVAARMLHALTNLTLLERPAPTWSVISAVQAAVRGRERQYQMRDQIESLRSAEAKSTELRQQLEIAVNASELGTFHCDLPLDRIVCNDRCKEHFWLPLEPEINFDLFYAILHPDDRERTRQAVEASVYGGQMFDIEYRTVSPRGEMRWVRATGRTGYNEHQQPVQFDGTTQDITNRKRGEEALIEADRRKDEFLAILAHELRNPLAPIRNGLQVLKMAKGDAEAIEQSHVMMERQLMQMVRLIDDLMDVSRITQGKVELRKERVELAKIVQQSLETSRPLIEAKNHDVTTVVPLRPIIVEADVARLTQVLSNLLNNAAKYCDPGGAIKLTVQQQGSDAVVSVKDTGVGIPAEMLPKVFDLFTQIDQSLEKSQGGLGIGLSLVKALVEMHGGSVEAQSEGHGKGSEFIVRVPVGSAVTEPVPPSRKDDQPACPSKCCRILVADDNADAATTLAMLLKVMGNEVRTAKDGLHAVNVAMEFRPDVILLDIGMPKLNGYETCRRMRHEAWAENAVFIALTGWGQEDDRRQSKEAGFHHHLVKPVDLTVLNNLLTGLQVTKT